MGGLPLDWEAPLTTYTVPHSLPIIDPATDNIKDATASALANHLNNLATATNNGISREGSRAAAEGAGAAILNAAAIYGPLPAKVDALESSRTTQDARIAELETLGGLNPGDTTDATMANVAADTGSSFHNILTSTVAERFDRSTATEDRVVEDVYTYLTGRVSDERGDFLPNGLRRSLQLRKPLDAVQYPNGDWSGQYQSADGEPVNTTSGGKALKFLALYALTLDSRPRHVLDDVRLFADNLLALQWNDPDKLITGGFRLAPTDSRASAFGTATAARAILAAYKVTRDSKYLTAAIAAGDFLLRLADPNSYWFPKYGVDPITRTVGSSTWNGFCDRVNANDQITTTNTTWNLLAAVYLHELYTETGVVAYETAATQARDFLAHAVLNGYDYFAVTSTNGAYVSTTWPNDTNHVYADHQFHRLGDMAGTGTVGTDQVEYGIVCLWALGYDIEAVKTAYQTYRDLPHDDPTSPFGAAYDAGACFAGYFRLTGDVLGDTGDRHFGSYYDSQGAGELLAFKRVFFPADYVKARQITDIITHRAALLDENLETIWSTTPTYNYATQGTIPIAAAGIGILESITATEGA